MGPCCNHRGFPSSPYLLPEQVRSSEIISSICSLRKVTFAAWLGIDDFIAVMIHAASLGIAQMVKLHVEFRPRCLTETSSSSWSWLINSVASSALVPSARTPIILCKQHVMSRGFLMPLAPRHAHPDSSVNPLARGRVGILGSVSHSEHTSCAPAKLSPAIGIYGSRPR